MKLLFKVTLIYACIFSIIGILLGIYKVFELSMFAGFFLTGIYIASIVAIVLLLIKFLDQLKEKIQPFIKKLEKFKKCFKWLK